MAVTLDEADLSGSNLTRDEASRLLAQPLPDAPDARWPGGAKIAVSIVLNYEEGGENNILHGDGQSDAHA